MLEVTVCVRWLALVQATESPGRASAWAGENAANWICTGSVAACAPAAAHSAKALARLRALVLCRIAAFVLADDDLGLHPRVDQAHEPQCLALGCGHLEIDRLAVLARAGQARVARTVHVGRRVLAHTVLEVLELRWCIAVGVGAVRLSELLADLAVE